MINEPKRTRRPATGGGRFSPGAAAEPLVAYFADIAHIPTLSREEQMLAAKELEEATRGFQEALYQIPWVAEEVVARWSRRRSAGLATRKLSEAFGDGEAAAGEKLDRALARVERALARRREAERRRARSARRAGSRRISTRRSSRSSSSAACSRACASGAPRCRRAQDQRARAARAELERELGLPAAAFHARMDEVEQAYAAMMERKNRFVWHNLKLVVSVAKDFRGSGFAVLRPDPGGQRRA